MIPVADPHRSVVSIRDELDEALARVLDGGRYVLGPEHDRFEEEFAHYLGASSCIGVASGTDALELAFRAVRCEAGDEIITVANAGFYASAAARACGLDVRYADVDPVTLTLSASTLEAACTPRTRAVVVTHLYGVMAEIERLADFCRARGIALVEDCAQAAGATRAGRFAGTYGDVAAFSFYPTKNLAALGDAGAVVSNDGEIADRVRSLRQYGWETKYRVAMAGGRNSRLDDVQAAVLRVRLSHLDAWNDRRRAIALTYAEAVPAHVGRFVAREGGDYVAHLAVGLFEDRDSVRERLHAAGIGTDVHYPVADHRQRVWDGRFHDLVLPVTEHAVDHVLTLPCFPDLTDNEVDRICEALDEL